jgi:hypothetical protein
MLGVVAANVHIAGQSALSFRNSPRIPDHAFGVSGMTETYGRR